MSPDRVIRNDPLSYHIARRPEQFPAESSNTGTEKKPNNKQQKNRTVGE